MSGRTEKARRAAIKAAQAQGVEVGMGEGAVAVGAQLPFVPRTYQRAAHAARMAFRFLVLVWHRRAGKTVFCIIELILAAAVCQKPLGRFGYIAPFLSQAKEIAWEYLKAFTAAIPGSAVNESELSVTLPNGARIRLYGADHPDSIRGGYFDGVVLDEYGDMKPALWDQVLRPALSDRLGWAVIIGTPKGINAFSEQFFKAQRGEQGWWADLKRASDTKVIDAAELEAAAREMGPTAYAQEYECDFFASAANVLCSLEAIKASIARDYHAEEYEYAARVLGVDCARYGDDRSVVARRQGLVAFRMNDDGPETHVYRKLDTMQLASQVAYHADKFEADAIFVDSIGIGAGVADRLRQLGYRALDVDSGTTKGIPHRMANKKAAMWWDLAQWLKTGAMPDDPVLVQELTAQTYTYANRSGKLEMDAKELIKERIKRSPDKADALALTFAEPVVRSHQNRAVGPGGRGQAVHTEYDPYAA